MIDVGDSAPHFQLPGTQPTVDDPTVEEYSLSDALVSGPAILVFYPRDVHPECDGESCGFPDLPWFLLNDDVTVFGISSTRDDVALEHGKISDLPLRVLSDVRGVVIEGYGVLGGEIDGGRPFPERALFVVDTEGVVRYAWRGDTPDENPDWASIKFAVDAARQR